MMYRNKIVIALLLTLSYLLSPFSDTDAYQRPTHRVLSKKAIQYSCLQNSDYLKSIGINSIEEKFDSNDPIQWIELGADEEDSWSRPINHFHNPLHQWSDAGLNNFFLGQSSLLWAQDASNEFSWQDVRQYFYNALTSSSAESRETGFANVFETLGHLLHLVQDCACPPHTRNDAHVLVASGYEGWANDHRDEVLNYALPFGVDVDLAVSVEGYEPITQFFDTNQYMGFAPSTSNTQGLAEYTNANFASEDTIFTENFFPDHIHYFPFPRRADTEEYDQDMGGRLRTYFRKVQNGEAIEHFAVAGRFYRYLPWWPEVQIYFIGFDKLCHANYALKLIPPAVGYSVALLDYFFRGEIDLIENPDNPDGYVIENKTEEDMNGTFELYYDNIHDERVKLPGENGDFPVKTLISAGGKSGNIDFTPPDDAKEPCKYILVFRGQMGSETDAVVGKVVDGIKTCGFHVVMQIGSHCTVWDLGKDQVADNISLNGGGTTTFPTLSANISNWIASKNEIFLDDLFGSQDESGSWGTIAYSLDQGQSYNNSKPCPPPEDDSWEENYGTYADKTWQASRIGVFGTNSYEKHDDETNRFYGDCASASPVENWWDSSHSITLTSYSKKGFRLTALNGSGEILDHTVTATESEITSHYTLYDAYTYYCTDHSYSRDYTKTVPRSTPYFSLSGGVQNIITSCSGCYGGNPCTPTGSADPPVSTDINIEYEAHYSETYKAIIQLFIHKDDDANYHGYGQADIGIDQSAVPSSLSENCDLSSALESLATIANSNSITAAYYK